MECMVKTDYLGGSYSDRVVASFLRSLRTLLLKGFDSLWLKGVHI